LCCVCCKIAIQDFVTGLHKKKNYVLPTGIPTEYNPSVFHRELKKINGIVPHSLMALLTEHNPSVFHRELQKNYRIVPQSPTVYRQRYWRQIATESPTNSRTSRSACMSDTCPSAQIPTAVPASNTDEFTHILKRTHVWHLSVCTNTDGVSNGSKSLAGFSNFFWCAFQLIFDGITDGI
jgi:hypothetical protein